MTALTPDRKLTSLPQPPDPEEQAEPGVCYHCGEPCGQNPIEYDGKCFCCTGCSMVYQILQEKDMCRYYELDQNPGISLKGRRQERYEFLDDEEVVEALLDFRNERVAKVTLHLPQIHCASCVWLLENLYRLREGIIQSRVHFMKKEVSLTFDPARISLRQIVELLASVGYPPAIHLASAEKGRRGQTPRRLLYQIGIAGFAFGNVMLLSFPEYLGLDLAAQQGWVWVFGYLNLLLSLPVLFYSGVDYLRSAWQGLRMGQLNIDVPVSLGMLTLFGRSTFEVLTQTGPGYFDSLAGLVFFLLVGKWYQQKTWAQLSFDRDYKSWLPLAATLVEDGGERSVPVRRLQAGDRIRVRHGELVPADGILVQGDGRLDYSFVTGEAEPQPAAEGEKVFAGARQVGGAIEVVLTKAVEQSYLTRLWNEQSFAHKQTQLKTELLADRVGKWFTAVVLVLAFGTLAWWWPRDVHAAIDAFTAVLIIACPCAVALAIPFTFGNAVRIL
ncbi:MAG: heavy metal translocating P-type ATPase, partial [Bacteroidetes bacterium]